MLMTAQGPFREPESTTTKWVVIFILISLLVHAIILAIILLITVVMPVPKIEPIKPDKNDVTLSVIPAPPVEKPKTIFVPTTPQTNVKHTQKPIVSANDTDLTTKAQVAQAPESLMPQVDSQLKHGDLNTSPLIKAPDTPQPSTTPPTPRQAKPDKPTPPQPKPDQAKQPPQPQPPQPPKPAPPTPPKPKPPTVDPDTGLPVLPPLNVQTMAPPDAAAPPLAPAPSMEQQAASSHGALGHRGDNSPAAMASILGKYKQKVYQAVGSRWYPKVDNAFQVLGVGVVHIQFTIYQDGTVTTKVLDAGDSTMQTLLSLSLNSVRESAPFDKFDDYPGLRDEIIKEQGGDGSSYTDDFTFTIYGH